MFAKFISSFQKRENIKERSDSAEPVNINHTLGTISMQSQVNYDCPGSANRRHRYFIIEAMIHHNDNAVSESA